MAKVQKKPKVVINDSMNGALIWSVVIHLIILSASAFALPRVTPERVIDKPFPVEIVEIDEITQTNKKPKPHVKEEQPEPPKKEPEKVDAEVPPDLLTPQPREAPEPVPDPDKLEEPKEEPPPKKPEPPKKKPVTKKEPPKEQKDFQSLLKNLMPAEEDDKQDAPDEGAEEAPAIDDYANKLTMSEEDALRAQLARCWNVMAGAKYAEELVVIIKAEMNPDRTVRQAMIADQLRYNQDSHFRAAADAALRALRNPNCTPLQLPPEKFEEWKTITIRFDPRDML